MHATVHATALSRGAVRANAAAHESKQTSLGETLRLWHWGIQPVGSGIDVFFVLVTAGGSSFYVKLLRCFLVRFQHGPFASIVRVGT